MKNIIFISSEKVFWQIIDEFRFKKNDETIKCSITYYVLISLVSLQTINRNRNLGLQNVFTFWMKCIISGLFIFVMAGEDNRLVEKIAFCSVLCAGFAYAGYNVVSKMCHRKPEPKENRFSQTVITGFIGCLCI